MMPLRHLLLRFVDSLKTPPVLKKAWILHSFRPQINRDKAHETCYNNH